MKYSILLLMLLWVLSTSCHPEDTGFGGTQSISGRVLYLDSLGISKLPAVNATVYVGFGTIPTPENYGFKTSTDSLGNFTINNVQRSEEAAYRLLVIHKVEISGVEVLYTKALDVKPGVIADFEVERDKYLKRIEGTVRRKLTSSISDMYVAGATVYIGYSSTPTKDKYLLKLVTDENGKFASPYLKIVEPEKYNLYVTYQFKEEPLLSAKATLADLDNADGVVLLAQDSEFSSVNGIVNGYDYISDGRVVGLSNADVYGAIGFEPSAENYTFKTKSVQQGRFSINNIPKSDVKNLYYFVRYDYISQGKSVSFEKSFRASGEQRDLGSILLLPTESPGICQLRIIDESGTPQPNVSVCVFSNRAAFANSKGCSGSFFEEQTNLYGNVFVNDLRRDGTYYIRGLSVVGGDTLKLKVDESIKIDHVYPQVFTLKIK